MFRNILLLFLLQIFTTSAFGNAYDTLTNYSPYHAIHNHFHNLQHDSYAPSKSAQSLQTSDSLLNIKRAIQLKQIFDGKGFYVNLQHISTNPDYIDSITHKSIYVISQKEPRIYLEKKGSSWFYSNETYDAIPKMHKEVYPFGTHLLVNLLSKKSQISFGGIQVWQWVGLLLLLFLAYIIYKIISFVFSKIIKQFADLRFGKLAIHKTKSLKAGKALGLFLTTKAISILIPTLLLHPKINLYLVTIFSILGSFFFILFLIRAVDILMEYFEQYATTTTGTLDNQLIPVLRKIIKLVIIIGGLIFILDQLEVNVTALLAGISIGGLAIALAAQDTVKNLFGSLMIFLDRPFQIGDGISFSGVSGTVEEVGIRSTRIRTFNNSLVSVPNGKITDAIIDNLGMRIYRRWKTDLGLTYNTPTQKIESFIEGVRLILSNHNLTKKDAFEVHLNNFGASSLNVLMSIYFETNVWTEELKARHEIMLDIIKLAEKLDVQFAFPSTSVYIEQMAKQ